MMDPEDLPAAQALLVRDWQIRVVEHDQILDYEVLLEELQARVLHLLRYNPQKLMTALYILDISERRYAAAMDQPTMDDRAWDLARAILERETEKIATRRKYATPRREQME